MLPCHENQNFEHISVFSMRAKRLDYVALPLLYLMKHVRARSSLQFFCHFYHFIPLTRITLQFMIILCKNMYMYIYVCVYIVGKQISRFHCMFTNARDSAFSWISPLQSIRSYCISLRYIQYFLPSTSTCLSSKFPDQFFFIYSSPKQDTCPDLTLRILLIRKLLILTLRRSSAVGSKYSLQPSHK